jgi:hypothetical protein
VAITECGTLVSQIEPVVSTLEDRLQRLTQANLLAWSGRKLGAASPATVGVQGAKAVSELLLEDRR